MKKFIKIVLVVLVSIIVSLAAAEGRVDERAPAFLRDWPEKFDYLYVVGPAKPNPLPSRLDEIMRGRKFVLYRIRRAGGL